MTATVLLASSDPGFPGIVAPHLASVAHLITLNAIIVRSVKEVDEALLSPAGPQISLMVLEDQLPRDIGCSPDGSGRPVYELLNSRTRGKTHVPAVVLTHQATAPTLIDRCCTPDRSAIALSLDKVVIPGVLSAFAGMLSKKPTMSWNTIEVIVSRGFATCWLGREDGELVEWGQSAINQYTQLQLLASIFEKRQSAGDNWLDDLRYHGGRLFQDLVIDALGASLYSHIERAAGGLTGLNFRFFIEDPTLYAAPFEAIGQFDSSDARHSLFFLLYAPIARRIKPTTKVTWTPDDDDPSPRPQKLLFIKAQLEKTAIAEVRVQSSPNAPGLTEFRKFKYLKNIELEQMRLLMLEHEQSSARLDVDVLDLSKPPHVTNPSAALEKQLADNRYDIVHFAGHSLSTWLGPDGVTYLILPSADKTVAKPMRIEDLAQFAGKGKVRLVYLSSCNGSSTRSVTTLVQNGVPHVVGFRWDVDDEKAADFAILFYEALFKTRVVSKAFRLACNLVHRELPASEASQIWASPILIAQDHDWTARPFLNLQ